MSPNLPSTSSSSALLHISPYRSSVPSWVNTGAIWCKQLLTECWHTDCRDLSLNHRESACPMTSRPLLIPTSQTKLQESPHVKKHRSYLTHINIVMMSPHIELMVPLHPVPQWCIIHELCTHMWRGGCICQQGLRAHILHLKTDPAAQMTVSKPGCALYNIKELYIDMADPVFLLLQKYSTQQATIIDITWGGRS